MSINSLSKNSRCALEDLWGSRDITSCNFLLGQRGIENLTGAPWCLSYFSRRFARYLILRLEKSLRCYRCLTNSDHPRLRTRLASRIMYSPKSVGRVEVGTRSFLRGDDILARG